MLARSYKNHNECIMQQCDSSACMGWGKPHRCMPLSQETRTLSMNILGVSQAEASIESTVGQLAELKSAMAATVAEGAEQAAAKQQEVAALQEQLQQVGHTISAAFTEGFSLAGSCKAGPVSSSCLDMHMTSFVSVASVKVKAKGGGVRWSTLQVQQAVAALRREQSQPVVRVKGGKCKLTSWRFATSLHDVSVLRCLDSRSLPWRAWENAPRAGDQSAARSCQQRTQCTCWYAWFGGHGELSSASFTPDHSDVLCSHGVSCCVHALV